MRTANSAVLAAAMVLHWPCASSGQQKATNPPDKQAQQHADSNKIRALERALEAMKGEHGKLAARIEKLERDKEQQELSKLTPA